LLGEKQGAGSRRAGFSIGSLGRDKSDLLNGEGPINGLFSRNHSRLFAMRLTGQDCAADESGPSPRVPSDPFDNRVFGSSIFHHIGRTYGSRFSFPVLQGAGSRRWVVCRRGGWSGSPCN
jgi:hypothetical protein